MSTENNQGTVPKTTKGTTKKRDLYPTNLKSTSASVLWKINKKRVQGLCWLCFFGNGRRAQVYLCLFYLSEFLMYWNFWHIRIIWILSYLNFWHKRILNVLELYKSWCFGIFNVSKFLLHWNILDISEFWHINISSVMLLLEYEFI